jgi:Protein of unknown function (DUF3540)
MNTQAENIIPIQSNLGSENHLSNNFSAYIQEINTGEIIIAYQGRLMKAETAFSCLAQPMTGDKVLISCDQHQQAYIIAILKREQADQMTMQLPARTIINSSENITLASQQISQLAQKQINKSCEHITEFDQAIIKGNKLHSHIRQLHSISDMVSTIAKQAIQKFNSYVRKSDTSDQVQAAQMSRKVDGLYTMNSKHTIMVSQKDTKIDGEHIHMG